MTFPLVDGDILRRDIAQGLQHTSVQNDTVQGFVFLYPARDRRANGSTVGTAFLPLRMQAKYRENVNVHIDLQRKESLLMSVHKALQISSPRARQGDHIRAKLFEEYLRDCKSQASVSIDQQRFRAPTAGDVCTSTLQSKAQSALPPCLIS